MEYRVVEPELYEKYKVIEHLGRVMKGHSSVESSELALFAKKKPSGELVYQEYLVVHYRGGAIACRNINMNSHSANLREFSKLVDGGYYDEVKDYEYFKDNWAHCHFMTDGSLVILYKERLEDAKGE